MAELLGFALADLYAQPDWDLLTSPSLSGFRTRIRHQEGRGAERYEVIYDHPDGSRRILRVAVSPFMDDGCTLGSLAMISDITDFRIAEEALRHRASHDPLTGLANRTLLLENLRQALDGTNEADSVAVLVADIDQFKLVNDSFGHDAGDELLMEVSRRWQATLRPDELFARFGGDEFVVLCRETDEAAALHVADRLLDTLRPPVLLAGRPVAASASIGVATATAGGSIDARTLLRNADAAMYEAKARGRSRTEVFTPRLIERAQRKLQLYNDLKVAIDQGQLSLKYQPIVKLATCELLGVEALCRWDHPDRGAVSPDEFIKAAEAAGLIAALDRWVLNRACHDAVALRAAGVLPSDAYLSVNKSAFSLAQHDCEATIRAALTDSGLPAKVLVLEVTESAVMADPDAAQQVLESLHSLGVRVAIVTAIADLGKALNLNVTAEGVETASDLALLQKLCCLAGQGYLWSAAISPDELAAVMRNLPEGRFPVHPQHEGRVPVPLPPQRTRSQPSKVARGKNSARPADNHSVIIEFRV